MRTSPLYYMSKMNVVRWLYWIKKSDIYNKEVEVTRAHMGLGRERWYKNGEETFPLFEDSEEGKQWRRQVQNGTLPETE